MQHATLSAQKGYPESAETARTAITDAIKDTKTREIEREMVNLDVAAQSLNGALTALLDRLVPVMRAAGPETQRGSDANIGTSTPMGGYLRTQAKTMDRLAGLLRDAYDRLELP